MRTTAGKQFLPAILVVLCLLPSCGTPKKHEDKQKEPKSGEASVQGRPGREGTTAREIPSRDTPSGKVTWIQEREEWRSATVGEDSKKPGLRILYFRVPREFGCDLLETRSFRNDEVVAFLRDRAVCHYVLLKDARDLARRYGVGDADIPALIALDNTGGFVGSIIGYRPPTRLLGELKALLEATERLARRGKEIQEKLKTASGTNKINALDAAAGLALERREFKRARTFLKQLVEQPGIAKVRSLPVELSRLAQVCAELGDVEEADQLFERAVAADSLEIYSELISFRRARARTLLSDPKLAAAQWRDFIKKHPDSEHAEAATYNLIYCLLEAGQTAEATRELTALLEDLAQTEHAIQKEKIRLARRLSGKDPNPKRQEQVAKRWQVIAKQLERIEETRQDCRLLLYSTGSAEKALGTLRAEETRRQFLADALAEGRDLAIKYDCHDCHIFIEPSIRASRSSCVQCHLLIRRYQNSPGRHDALLRDNNHFFRNCNRVRHIMRAPDLFSVGARVQAEWLRRYLDNPFDIRPHLADSMIQLNLPQRDIDTFVRYFRAVATLAGRVPPEEAEARNETELPEPSPELVKQGRKVFEEQKCHACHQFGNVRFGAQQGTASWEGGRAEAPNLRFARDRLIRRTAKEWIRDPTKVNPETRMPKFTLSEKEVEALVAFIFNGDLGDPPVDINKPRPRLKLSKTPSWEEVNAAIFHNTCEHCHMTDREGGAGNLGAYGYRGPRLDLTSYARLRRGSLQADGTRLDILKPRPGSKVPVILERVYRRVEENRRDLIKPYRDPLTDLFKPRKGYIAPGMPLGHPSLTPEEIALLEAWIEGGAPGPKPKPIVEEK